MPLLALPNELLMGIETFLPLRDVCSFSLANRHLYQLPFDECEETRKRCEHANQDLWEYLQISPAADRTSSAEFLLLYRDLTELQLV